MKRIYVMDCDGIQEYIPINRQNEQIPKIEPEQSTDLTSGDPLLTIADLTKKFAVSSSTIYSWIKKGLLKRIPLEGRVLFHPN